MKRFFSNLIGSIVVSFLATFSLPVLSFSAFAASEPLIVVSFWGNGSPDPLLAGEVYTRMGCLETLTTVGEQGEIIPRLAKSWEISKDQKTWTFHLRKGVQFHDGNPMNAEAVRKSLQRVLSSKLFSSIPIQSLHAVDSSKLLVQTSIPFPALPAYLAHYTTGIVSPKAIDEKGGVTQVLGTGFYRLVNAEGDRLADYERFPQYWGTPAKIEKVRYLKVKDAGARTRMAEAGEAHLVFGLSPLASRRMKRNPRVDVVSQAIPRVRILKINTQLPYFDTVAERKAFSMAIDREGIAASLLNNVQVASTQLMPPAIGNWHNQTLSPFEYNLQEAKRLLESEGWKLNQDGIYEKSGDLFEVELLTYASRPMLPVIAEALQAQLKKVGISIKIKIADWTLIPEKHQNGTLETSLVARNYGLIPEPIGTLSVDFGINRGDWGATGWFSFPLQKLMDEYQSSFDQQKRKILRSQIAQLLHQEQPVIPITWFDKHTAVNRKLLGVRLDPYELRPYLEGVTWANN